MYVIARKTWLNVWIKKAAEIAKLFRQLMFARFDQKAVSTWKNIGKEICYNMEAFTYFNFISSSNETFIVDKPNAIITW